MVLVPLYRRGKQGKKKKTLDSGPVPKQAFFFKIIHLLLLLLLLRLLRND